MIYEQQESYALGSVTVASFVGGLALIACALLAALTATRTLRRRPVEPGCWWAIAAILAILALYRLLGLQQSWLAAVRSVAQESGWYADRRLPQVWATCLLLLSAILPLAAGVSLLRQRLSSSALGAGASTYALLGLYVLRDISLHAVDSALYAGIGPVRVNWILEAGLLLTISGSAFVRAFSK